MSSLFGDRAEKGAPSLTESIFGTASTSTGTSDLFAKKATTHMAQLPPRKRPRAGDNRSQNSDKINAETHDDILERRLQQSQRDILDSLTISLDNYDHNDEFNADVRGILKHHGLVIIRNVLSSREVDTLLEKADATQQSMCELLDAKKIPYRDEVNNHTEGARFQELAVRCQGRMDVRYNSNTDPTISNDKKSHGNHSTDQDDNNPTKKEMPIALPLLDTLADSVLHGAEPSQLVYAGWIFSFPGSVYQPWHQDGSPLFGTALSTTSGPFLPSYAINAFIGLHDDYDEDDDPHADLAKNGLYRKSTLSLELGPTEFVVGSHHMAPHEAMAQVDMEHTTNPDKQHTESFVVSAVLGKGDVLLYDYRICHRGTSNISGAATNETSHDNATKKKAKAIDDGVIRKVLYLMYARPWFREHLNFGDRSLFEEK